MKKWMPHNKGYIIDAALGGLAGLYYWKYVGCLTGTCAPEQQPVFHIDGHCAPGFFPKIKFRKSKSC